MAASQLITLTVRLPSGPPITLEMTPDETVENVKWMAVEAVASEV